MTSSSSPSTVRAAAATSTPRARSRSGFSGRVARSSAIFRNSRNVSCSVYSIHVDARVPEHIAAGDELGDEAARFGHGRILTRLHASGVSAGGRRMRWRGGSGEGPSCPLLRQLPNPPTTSRSRSRQWAAMAATSAAHPVQETEGHGAASSARRPPDRWLRQWSGCRLRLARAGSPTRSSGAPLRARRSVHQGFVRDPNADQLVADKSASRGPIECAATGPNEVRACRCTRVKNSRPVSARRVTPAAHRSSSALSIAQVASRPS